MLKIRIAFIKFGGLSAGGTEKFLQTIAANLNKEEFFVDYYYCDSTPYIGSNYKHANTDQNRKKYMEDCGVNLIKFEVDFKDITTFTHDWLNSNFWELFSENKYDIIQTGRAGHPEYPFYKIKKTPIIDSIHTLGGVDNKYNISRVMHITEWSANKWIKMGGDKKRIVYVSHPMEIHSCAGDLRKILELDNKFIFGFHQRDADSIFSSIPLEAYKSIENSNTYFLIMGGSSLYSKQAQELKIKNFKQLPHSAKSQDIYNFLQTLNVYAHGRKDGELNSTAMAEAMFFGLPIVSHKSSMANGHIECIAEAGKVLDSVEEYSEELLKLINDKDYFNFRSKKAKERFLEKYELKRQIKNIENIYKEVFKNPFPFKNRRVIYDIFNKIKIILFNRYTLQLYHLLKNIYGKTKSYLSNAS